MTPESFQIRWAYKDTLQPESSPLQEWDNSHLVLRIREDNSPGAGDLWLEAQRLYSDEVNQPHKQKNKTYLNPAELTPAQHRLLETVQRTMATQRNENMPPPGDDMDPNVFLIRGLVRVTIDRATAGPGTDVAEFQFDSQPDNPIRIAQSSPWVIVKSRAKEVEQERAQELLKRAEKSSRAQQSAGRG